MESKNTAKVTRKQVAIVAVLMLLSMVAGLAMARYVVPAQPTDTTNLHYCYHFIANSNNVPPPFNQFLHGDNGTYTIYVCRTGP